MKMLKTFPDKCITCHNCESACSKLYFKEDNAKKSCVVINEAVSVSYTNLRAHETPEHLECRLLLEKKKKPTQH